MHWSFVDIHLCVCDIITCFSKQKQELGDESDIDRAILWKKGRVGKDGNYLSETIKQRADKIVS